MSNKANAVGESRKYWGVIPVMPGQQLMETARQMEQLGYTGTFSYQVFGPPFIPNAVAAAATTRLQIASGIAIAGVRSPFETAMAAMDVDRISEGRFILGLGSSAPTWTKDIFGAGEFKPIAQLRDTVAAVRHIINGAHKGLEPYEGEYFKASFRELKPTDPPFRTDLPIWIAALREKLLRTGVEIGDGVIGHPMWSSHWAVNEMGPVIADALAECGKQRSDIEVNVWPWMAINDDHKQAVDDARGTVAFYASVAPYESFFEAHGFGAEARACQAEVEQGVDVESLKKHVPDEMVETFAACGPMDVVAEKIEPFWAIADSICPTPPIWGLSQDKVAAYAEALAGFVAAQAG
jgi:alkanesulfonate monooxygenase SsuD/methylene tetrahydromethanopterin reductase-like flavin-dependent oxidoreductase (luciferase family)